MKLRLISSITDHSDRAAVIVLWLRQRVPVIWCDDFFLQTAKTGDRQLTEADAVAVGATPTLVIRH